MDNRSKIPDLVPEAKNSFENTFEIIEDGRLLKDLNTACEKGDISLVRKLIRLIPPSSCSLKFTYKPPLFWACKTGQYATVKVLVEEYHCDPQYVTERGHTLVHVACARGHAEVARYLTKQHLVDPNRPNGDNATPLLAACYNGHIDAVVLLIDELKCDPKALGEQNDSLLHIACRNGHTEIARLLVTKYHFDPMARNPSAETPLHIASSKGRLAIVEYLVDELKCPVQVYDKYSSTPLHNACRNGQTDIVKHLVDGHNCSLDSYDSSGCMPFHIACKYGRNDVIKLLLERAFDPNTLTLCGETALEIVRDKETATELIQKGAKTNGMNLEILQHYRDQLPLDALVHLLVIGHETSGKSTIVQALQIPVSGSGRFLRSFFGPCLVKGVEPHTAGIVPISFTSPEFGKVMLFDFAGQNEYHSSHAAVLEHSYSSSSPLFLLVVNLLDSFDIAKRRINYWINFVETNPIPGGNQPHSIVIASHCDQLRKLYPKEYRVTISALESFTLSRFKSSKITLDGFFALDCREVSSDKHAQLRRQLKASCEKLRSNIRIDAECHVLMVFLLKEFQGKLFCTIKEVSDKVPSSGYPLPILPERLCELAEVLSTRTEILLIRHKLCPEESWILLQIDIFLSEIHGKMFAPRDFPFPNHLEASQAGVVQWSQLRHSFADFLDPNLVVAFLGHFEECQVIDDPLVLTLIDPQRPSQLSLTQFDDDDVELDSPGSMLSPIVCVPHLTPPAGYYANYKDGVKRKSPTHICSPCSSTFTQSDVLTSRHYSSSPQLQQHRPSMPASSEKYLFIPGLVTADSPGPGVWIGSIGFTLHFGWVLQCEKQEFFSPRFLQALLLRLTFGFAVSQPTSHSNLKLSKREFTVWKNGLRWLNLDGIETLVEFFEDRKAIILLMRAKEKSELKCVRLRSSLIQKILETKTDYCPDLATLEYLIHPSHLEGRHGYPVIREPLSSLKKYDVCSIAEAFVARCYYVYDTKREDFISIDKLIYFDSYNGVNQAVLCWLHDHQRESKELTQDLLQEFSFCHPNRAEMFQEVLLCQQYHFLLNASSCRDNPCLQVLVRYHNTDARSVRDFRGDLDTHSLFSGRNILEVQHSTSPVSDLTGQLSLCHFSTP